MFAKLGNGTVRDLTLDTNTVYTHPSTKQCNYSVNTSNFVTKNEPLAPRLVLEYTGNPNLYREGGSGATTSFVPFNATTYQNMLFGTQHAFAYIEFAASGQIYREVRDDEYTLMFGYSSDSYAIRRTIPGSTGSQTNFSIDEKAKYLSGNLNSYSQLGYSPAPGLYENGNTVGLYYTDGFGHGWCRVTSVTIRIYVL